MPAQKTSNFPADFPLQSNDPNIMIFYGWYEPEPSRTPKIEVYGMEFPDWNMS